MDIITIEGDALEQLIVDLGASNVRTLRVARDTDGVKFKINEGLWTPPYPEADEDVRRREQARHPATGGDQGFEDDRW
jgi:hypothetical protein